MLCGDLFTQLGDGRALSTDSPMDPAIAAEDALGYSSLSPNTVPTIERLADLSPRTLALMHGPAHQGDAGVWLRDLAASYAGRSLAAA